MTPPKEQSNRTTTVLSGEERRRSQRVMIRVPVTLEVVEDGQTVRIAGQTVEVNDHGAMVACPRTLDSGTNLVVINERTSHKVDACVTRAPREGSKGYEIPVAFTSPAANFWEISFPPANWKAPEN